ncbi:MAG: hypothetical protein L0Z50_10020 [Verrucomicrobiales bacterium]|nr:hypothetical protein [Verrucomicrobiales bacterium]
MKTTKQPLQTIKRIADTLAFSLAVCALLTPTAASAQSLTPFFMEDFEGGNATDGSPVTRYVNEAALESEPRIVHADNHE